MRMTRLTTIARTGRLTKRSVRRILTLLRLRGRLVAGLDLVVNQNGYTVAQLEHTGTDDFFARLQARQDRDLIAARGPELHKLLAHAAVRLTVRIFEVFDDEYRISVGRVADRGGRQRHGRMARAQQNVRLNEHSGSQPPVWVGQCGLDLNVSSRLIDDRIDGRDLSRERNTSQVFSRDAHGVPGHHLACVLLRHAEVHVSRIERLQRNNRVAARQVLTEINLTKAQDSRKRRPDRLPRDGGTDLFNLCLLLLLLGYSL